MTTKQDAISLLTADHRKVAELFNKYENTRGRKAALAKQICMELTIHTIIEEEIFYPACREAGAEVDIMDEANVEHDGAKVLMLNWKTACRKTNFTTPRSRFYPKKSDIMSRKRKSAVASSPGAQGGT